MKEEDIKKEISFNYIKDVVKDNVSKNLIFNVISDRINEILTDIDIDDLAIKILNENFNLFKILKNLQYGNYELITEKELKKLSVDNKLFVFQIISNELLMINHLFDDLEISNSEIIDFNTNIEKQDIVDNILFFMDILKKY